MEQSIQIAVATGFGAAFGAVIGNAFTLFNGWRERIAQNKRAQRDWAVKAAVEYWKSSIELAKSDFAKGRQVSIYPLDTYLIPMIALADKLANGTVTTDNLDTLISDFQRVNSVTIQKAREYADSRRE